jgi:DNA-binding response OmpR family regulator
VIPTCGVPLPSANGSNAQFTILCIEDDPAISRLYELRLSSWGARVLCSGNGRDGYASAIRSNPDLILLDNDLPDIQGFEVLTRLRSEPALVDVPVVMLTGLDTRTMQQRVFACGVLDVLPKPVNFRDLLEQVQRVSSTPRGGKSALRLASPAGNG